MSEWKTYKLGDLIECIIDNRGKSAPISISNYQPIIEINALGQREVNYDVIRKYVSKETYDTWFRAGHPKIGDILFSTVGTIGLTSLMTQDLGCIAQNIIALRVNDKLLNNLYLYYFLNNKTTKINLNNLNIGGVQPSIKLPHLLNMPISLPPLAEQKRIADILSAIDDKIELNRRINANLEQQAQALYKSWFVDFEPFGGKMPEDWREGTLGEIMTITSGKHPKNRLSIKTKDVNIPIVGAAAIIGYTNEMLYSTPILIIGRVGTHGIVQRFSTKCWPSDNTLVIQTKYYEMCYQLLKQIDYKKLNRGSTQPLITQTDIKGVEVIIPPIEILEEYENRVSILFHSINNYDIENSTLSALRDTLLPKLMSGEITV